MFNTPKAKLILASILLQVGVTASAEVTMEKHFAVVILIQLVSHQNANIDAKRIHTVCLTSLASMVYATTPAL